MTKKQDKSQKQIEELTSDLQRLRADFENYRKRVEADKTSLAELTKAATIMKLLPVIDNIERAIAHTPAELIDNKWVQGISSMARSLEKSLNELGLTRIEAQPGTPFDPNLHEAIMVEGDDGEHESVAEELRPGYRLGGQVIRPSMVKVGRK